jgi:hypothetical protein
MARTKIKNRARYASGKLRPETASPAVIRSIIDQAKRGAADPLLRTEVGRLRLNDVLTDSQVAAATRFAKIVGAYDKAKGLPRRTTASPSYERGFGRSNGGGKDDAEVIDFLAATSGNVEQLAKVHPPSRSVIQAQKRYDAARDALMSSGYACYRAVMSVAIYDEIVVSGDHVPLRTGLDRLAEHFS